jgi:hypothetical protein
MVIGRTTAPTDIPPSGDQMHLMLGRQFSAHGIDLRSQIMAHKFT